MTEIEYTENVISICLDDRLNNVVTSDVSREKINMMIAEISEVPTHILENNNGVCEPYFNAETIYNIIDKYCNMP